MAHALLSASGSARWSRCPGSVALESGLPDQSSPYAQEGTDAHLLASKALEAGVDVAQFLGAHMEVPQDDGTKRVVVVTQDMVDNVKVYVDAVRTYGSVEGASVYVEQRVDFSDVLGVPDSFGTGDAIIVVPSRREIQAHDLKYGMGVEVDAFEIATEKLLGEDGWEVFFNPGDEIPNSQLALYALGALEAHSLYADFDEVLLVIHQPRRGHLSEWRCSVETLQKFGRWLRHRAQIAFAITGRKATATGEIIPGEKQCRWCKAKATCPELRATVFDATASEFDDLTTSPDPGHDLSSLMSKVELIEDWCKAVRANCETQLLQGNAVPGWKLVEGKRGNRKWLDAQATEEFLRKSRLSRKQIYETSLISPATAEKVLKARPRLWAAIEKQITQSPGKLSVAPESDRRPAAKPGASADDFTTITGE